MKAVTSTVLKMDEKDSYGNTTFKVTLDNGDAGFYTSKNENQTNFVKGKEVEYNIEKKVGKSGKEYFKITLPHAERKLGGFQREDPKIKLIGFAMSYSKDLIVANKVKIESLESCFERIYNIMLKKI